MYDDNFKYTHRMHAFEDFISLYDLNQIIVKTNKEFNDLLKGFNKELAEKYGNVKIEHFNIVCFIAIIYEEYKYKLLVHVGNKELYILKNPDNSLVKIYNRNED